MKFLIKTHIALDEVIKNWSTDYKNFLSIVVTNFLLVKRSELLILFNTWTAGIHFFTPWKMFQKVKCVYLLSKNQHHILCSAFKPTSLFSIFNFLSIWFHLHGLLWFTRGWMQCEKTHTRRQRVKGNVPIYLEIKS